MKKYFAEGIGTFVLTLFGCGSAVGLNTITGNMGVEIPLVFTTLAIAFAFGLSVVAMAYAIGPLTGCHINPAVSIAMWINKKLSTKDFIGYIISQIIGAILAALCLAFLVGSTKSLGANGYGSLSALNSSLVVAFVIEVILTFVFIFTILNVTAKKETSTIAGLIIGLTLVLIHIFGIPFTGTSVNPARSLGPALITGGKALTQVWVFIVAPLLGSTIAAFTYKFLSDEK